MATPPFQHLVALMLKERTCSLLMVSVRTKPATTYRLEWLPAKTFGSMFL